jgi:hypothetical protein
MALLKRRKLKKKKNLKIWFGFAPPLLNIFVSALDLQLENLKIGVHLIISSIENLFCHLICKNPFSIKQM